MLDLGCVVACVIVGLMVKSRTLPQRFRAMSDSHPANEGADCAGIEADTPSWTLRATYGEVRKDESLVEAGLQMDVAARESVRMKKRYLGRGRVKDTVAKRALTAAKMPCDTS